MIVLIGLVIILAPFLWWFTVLHKHKKLNQSIPGPPLAPILGNALQLGRSPREFFLTIMGFQKKFGKVMRIYVSNEVRVVLASPDIMEQILGSQIHITKSNAYDLLKPWLGEGLLISTGHKWKSRRRLLTPTFHFKILDQFVETFNSCGSVLIEKLSREVGKEIDIYPFINLYSLDVICETSMGVRVEAQLGHNVEYVAAVRDYLDLFMIRAFSSWKRSPNLFKFSNLYNSYIQLLKVLHNFTNSIIQRRRETKLNQTYQNVDDDGIKRKVALLDLLLESENEQKLVNEDIREEIDTFMFEGHDTTTSGMAFAMFCLAENPEIQEKVYQEIVEILGDEKNVTMQHLQETKYLDLVVKEVMRLYPSVPVFERRLEQDANIAGYDIPKNVILSLNVFAMHRNEKYFPDPEKFDPNRFLPENSAQRHNYVYVPFSAGPRNCIGQKFAMLEMKSTIIKIVRNFKILPVKNFQLELGLAAVLKSYNGVRIRLENRNWKKCI